MRLKMASRKSDLARIQLHTVGEYLQKKLNINPEFIYRESFGDKNLDIELSGSDTKGLFTQDFYQALIKKEIDLVVHSWKDLPIEDKETSIVLTLRREDVRDVLLVKKSSLKKIKETHKIDILTSSPRREFFLKNHLSKLYPEKLNEISFTSIRGNVPTRLGKLIQSSSDALVIAKAALDRMLSVQDTSFDSLKQSMRVDLDLCNWMVLPLHFFPSAAAQGALAVEVLKGTEIEAELKKINFVDEFTSIKKERATLKSYGGGCHSRLGVNFITKSFGELSYFSREVDGELIMSNSLLQETKLPKVSTTVIWPEDATVVAERTPLKVDTNELSNKKGLWVSKSSALPEGFIPKADQKVWTSGLTSWQKLARRGVWVNGCAESLGEKEDMRLEHLCERDIQWFKLSHTKGAKTQHELIPTYKVEWSFTANDFKNKEHFYWMSGEMFKQALKVAPFIKSKHHYCGPGHTFDEIKQHVDQLSIHLNYKKWKKDITL